MKADWMGWSDQVAAAALNGIWQGVLVALVVALALRLAGGTNAATRYAAWFVTLLLVSVLIPAHCLVGSRLVSSPEPSPAADSPLPPDPPAAAAPMIAVWGEASGEPAPIDAAEPVRLTVDGPFALKAAPAESPGSPEPAVQVLQPKPAKGWSLSERSWISRAWTYLGGLAWGWPAALKLPRGVGSFLLALWLLLGLVRLSVLGIRLRRLRGLKRSSAAASESLTHRLLSLRAELGIRREVGLRISDAQRTPALLGFIRPVILLPRLESREQEAEIEPILRHELAHLHRWDDWTNLIQSFIREGLFFHPVVWWISEQLTLEREIACDDCVLQHGGAAREYALVLANLAARVSGPGWQLAPGVSTSKSQLKQRIGMILNTRRDTSPGLAKSRLGLITSAAALCAAAVVFCAPRLVLAQAQPARSAGEIPASQEPPDAPEPPSAPRVHPAPKPKQWDLRVEVPRVEPPRVGEPTPPRITPPATPPNAIAVFGSPGLEERLRRLERLVESLATRQQPESGEAARGAGQYGLPKAPDRAQEFALAEAEKSRQEATRSADHFRAMAAEAAKRAQEQERLHARYNTDQQIQELRNARENLSRELEKLDRQIDRLEQEKSTLKDRRSERGGLGGGGGGGERLEEERCEQELSMIEDVADLVEDLPEAEEETIEPLTH